MSRTTRRWVNSFSFCCIVWVILPVVVVHSETILSNKIWAAADSPIIITEPVVIAEGVCLEIQPGVNVRAGSNAAITVHGALDARGTPAQPVFFTRLDTEGSWPGLAFLGDRHFDVLTSTGYLAHCIFEYMDHALWAHYDLSASISAENAILSISNCTFRHITDTVLRLFDSIVTIQNNVFTNCGEGVNVVRCDAHVISNRFTHIRNGADAIDVDMEWSGLGWRPAQVRGNIIHRSSGDGIDLGGSAAVVAGNLVRNCADKGISIGEGSNARIENNVVLCCRLGVAIKDGSAPTLANNTIAGCETGVSGYEKSLGMGGARAHVLNSIIWDCGKAITLDELSLFDVRATILQCNPVWPGPGNQTNDPLFVDIEEDNVLLQAGSPALSAGIARRAATNDFHGTTRGASPSLGAFEDTAQHYDGDRDGVTDDADAFPFHPDWSEDNDLDHLPDGWEQIHFGDLSKAGDGDVDGDGIDNLQSFRLGLTPTNADRMIVINEIHYRPATGSDSNAFVELFNRGTNAVSLSGWQLTDRILFDFPSGTTLDADACLVVAVNPSSLEMAYGISGVLGPWRGVLEDEDGAVIRLVNGHLANVDTVAYQTHGDWPVAADGGGVSLELMQASADNNHGANWAGSAEVGGTPGVRNTWAEGDIVVNEFLASSGVGTPDWIELYNRGSVTQNLSGWFLSNDADDPAAWAIPAGSALAPGQTIMFTANDFGFGLSPSGEEIVLTRPDGVTRESLVSFGEQIADVTAGRWPNGFPSWSVYPSGGSPGAANPAPDTANVVINEIMYHPASEIVDEEFVELYNAGGTDVNLTEWMFSDGIAYAFPPDTILTAGQYMVIGREPAVITNKYGIDGVLGPYTLKLSNRGELVELRDAYGNVVDRVHYQDRGQWPRAADGEGPSLELLHPGLDNNRPESWQANPQTARDGTPGSPNSTTGSSSGVIQTAGHFPTTPDSSEPVTVRARASTGTNTIRLLWKRDQDTMFSETAMTNDGSGLGVYIAEIPPQEDRKLIEYYILVGDAVAFPFGAPTFHLPGTGRNVPLTFRYLCLDNQPSPNVPTFRLLIPSETQTELSTRNVNSDELLPVTLTYLDEVFPFARLRYRGLNKRLWSIKSYRVDLRADHPFADEDRLNVNGKRPGPEWLATEFCHQSGFATPIIQNIRLFINRQDQGPYLLGERIGNDYLARNFPGASTGTFHESWGETNVGAAAVYPVDVSDRLAVVIATNRIDYADYVTQAIEPDQWLRWLALTAVLGDHETLLNGIPFNHACYLHAGPGRLALEPLDMDATWDPTQAGMNIHINTPTPYSNWSFGLRTLEAFMRFPFFQRRYYEIITEVLDTSFTTNQLTGPIDRYYSVVGSTLKSDPTETLAYLSSRSVNLEAQISNLVWQTAAFRPAVTTATDGAVFWWPYASGWIEGQVLRNTAELLIDGTNTGVSLNKEAGAWRYAATLPEGDTVLRLAARGLANRPYKTLNQMITVRLDTEDDDGDSLPNSWELFYELNPNDNGSTNMANGRDGDPDGDGVPNDMEFRERTHPRYYDHVVVKSARRTGGQIESSWYALPGAVYRWQGSASLLTQAWTNASGLVTAETENATYQLSPGSSNRHYYRILLEQRP